MTQTVAVTPAQIRTGTSDDAFHFTAGRKQKTQSNSRLLWVGNQLRRDQLPGRVGEMNASIAGMNGVTSWPMPWVAASRNASTMSRSTWPEAGCGGLSFGPTVWPSLTMKVWTPPLFG